MRNTPARRARRRHPVGHAITLFAVILTTGCSHHRAHISYDEYTDIRLESEALTGHPSAERIGEVFVREGGAIWNDCTDVARGSLWVLVDEAKRRGGNAVGDIRWMPRSDPWHADRPTCKRRWALALVWPMLATPAFMAANVEGVIYRLDEGAAEPAGLYRLPDAETAPEAWADRVLAETLPIAANEGGS